MSENLPDHCPQPACQSEANTKIRLLRGLGVCPEVHERPQTGPAHTQTSVVELHTFILIRLCQ